MLQWRIYFAKRLVKRRYIVDADDRMPCSVCVTIPVATPIVQMLQQ